MSQDTITSAESCTTLPTDKDKWCTGVLSDQPVGEVARCILEARLRAVWSRLPLAAEKSAEDVEHVHQLRVATRRAVASVRLFSTLVPDEVCRDVRATLRQIRLAADEARNWDVLSDTSCRKGAKECSVDLFPTPAAVEAWNEAQGKTIGMFHVTC